MDSHSSLQALESELEAAKSSVEEAGRKSDSENRKLSNENRLLKSQLQALKEKSGVNEKYIESLKKDLKTQSEDKERATSQLEDSEEKLVYPKFTSTLKTLVLLKRILQAKLLEIQSSDFTRLISNDDLLLEDELDKLQHDIDALEALNQNIQGSLTSLNQFQITTSKRNPRNMIANSQSGASRSIDVTTEFMSLKNSVEGILDGSNLPKEEISNMETV